MNDDDLEIIREVKSALNTRPEEGMLFIVFYQAWIETISPWRVKILELRVKCYTELCKMREKYRHPKDKELTDFDRRTMLEAAVADVQADYELVKGLEELIKERIDLIKLLLRDK